MTLEHIQGYNSVVFGWREVLLNFLEAVRIQRFTPTGGCSHYRRGRESERSCGRLQLNDGSSDIFNYHKTERSGHKFGCWKFPCSIGLFYPPMDFRGLANLIPGIPNDIAALCLARIPKIFHSKFYLVSKAWNELLKSEQFYNMRVKHDLIDSLFIAISEDSHMESSSKQLVAFDLKHKVRCKLPSSSCELQRHLLFDGYKCSSVGSLFFILGGAFTDDFGLHGQGTVTIFNTVKNIWYKGASMNVARSYFASGVIDGLLYVVGGYNYNGEVEISGEVYNAKENSWSQVAPMPYGLTNIESDAVFQGRLFVKGRTSTGADDERKVLVYDPCSDMWEVKEELERNLLDGEFAATNDELYVLNRSGYIGKYNCAFSQWQQVGSISLYFLPFDCSSKQAIGFGGDVFFLNDLSGEPMDLHKCKIVHQVLPKVFWQWQGAILDA